MDSPLVESQQTEAVEVSGILFLSFVQACTNLDCYVDETVTNFLVDVRPDGWYALERYTHLLATVAERYARPEIILEQLGAEMMRLWYEMGPGKVLVQEGLDFLRHQTSSEGYHSVIRGEADEIGDFALVSLSEDKGRAIVQSTTPFSRDLERGVLRGGLALIGDLRLITVENAHDDDLFLIGFVSVDAGSQAPTEAIDAQTFLGAERLENNCQLEGHDLQEVFFRYKELEEELSHQRAFWQSTNETLAQALSQIQGQEEQLLDANQRLSEARNKSDLLKEAIVDVALDAVVTIDESSQIVEFNRSAERMFGYQRDEVIHCPLAEVIIPPDLRQAHLDGVVRYFATGEAKLLGERVRIEAMHADGHVFPVELSISEVQLANQRMFTAYIRDLTEIKQAEDEIARQRDALYQSEKLTALGSLLAGVAHELNNPLAIVMGRAVMLEQRTDDERTLRSVTKIREAADRCTRIVKTFLAMARREEPERKRTNLNDVIAASVELVGYSLRTAGIEITLDLQPELPDFQADDNQLHQVFTNLFVNAQQALLEMPEPRQLRVETQYKSVDNALRVTVTDNGPGVSEDIQSRIFEPFYTTKPVGTGTGVGLSLSYGIVTSHGGTIELVNPPSGGAQFVITLPCIGAEVTEVSSADKPVLHSGPCRILIVDDEPDFTEMLGEILTDGGHTVIAATSGREALKLLGEHDVDAILSDLHMADLNGPDFFEQIQQHHPHMVAHMAFITGDTLGATARQFLTTSGCPYLEKPFTPFDINILMQDLVTPSAVD